MHKLRYTKPADFWEESLPLGNGRIGAVVYGGIPRETIQLNEDTIWSGRPSDEEGYTIRENIDAVRQLIRDGKYAEATARTDEMTGKHDVESYELAGDILIDFTDHTEATAYERSLDLTTAIATSQYRSGDTTFTRESLVSAPHQVLAMRLSANQPGKLSFTLSMTSLMHHEIRTDAGNLILTGTCPARNGARQPDPDWEEDGQSGMRYVTKVRLVATGGSITPTDGSLEVTGADEVIVFAAIKTGFTSWDHEPSDNVAAMEAVCDKLLNAAESTGWDGLKAAHCEDYGSLYSRMTLDLGAADDRPTDKILATCEDPAENTALANLVFNYGRYLLISSSRPGTQPANLQGVWNDKLCPPWRSDFHTNINLQMNYWPAETCNLADCAEPLLDFVGDMAVSGQRPARKLYNARGWCMHHVSDVWRYPYTGGRLAQHAFWPVASAWLCQHLWEHYAFSGDEALLREAMPIMKEAAAFLLDFMIENNEGKLVTSPSTSPENRFTDPNSGEKASVCEGSAMDMTMIRELFENIAEGSRILGESDDLVEEVGEALPRLTAPVIGKDGRILEFGMEAEEPEPSHRHISHLYGVYPGWMFTPNQLPEHYEACRKSLDARGDKSTGWAMGWRVAMWARFLDGDRALSVIGNLMTYVNADKEVSYGRGGGLYANLWDAHPPFQIDGNFGVTAGIAEMLVQSHRTVNGKRAIDLLPALPGAWSSGSVTGLRARGGLTVASLEWQDGRVTALSLEAKRDIEMMLHYNDIDTELALKAGDVFTL